MGDSFLFVGSVLFIGLGLIAYFDPDALWKLYSKDRRWRRNNPEQLPTWEKRAKRHAIGFLVVGIIFLALTIFLEQR